MIPERPVPNKLGFTLIELLIVIAIILILVAIALPNFLEAQIRAKYTKVQGEIRSLGIALESYSVDWGRYPGDANEAGYADEPNSPFSPFANGRDINGIDWYSFISLTTPVAYMKEIPPDHFQEGNTIEAPDVPYLTYNYHETESLKSNHANGVGENNVGAIMQRNGVYWVVFGIGPDRRWQMETVPSNFFVLQSLIASKSGGSTFSYSPTNGTKSWGDIMRTNAFLK